MGTLSETFEEGPPIFFSHNDIVWATNFGLNRLGMGTLRVFIEATYKESTGKPLQSATPFGKLQVGYLPIRDQVLEQCREDAFGEEGLQRRCTLSATHQSQVCSPSCSLFRPIRREN